MTRPVVVVRQAGRVPLHIVLTRPLVLGRDCDGLLLADPQASRQHLELRPMGDQVLVVDLKSTNGTFLDGERLTEPMPLTATSVVRAGETTIELAGAEPSTGPSTGRATTLTTAAPIGTMTSIDVVADEVTAEQWRPAAGSDGSTVTILFSDIESSTERATSLGDEAWFELLEEHNAIVRNQLARHGGTEVKSQGDGFMLTYPSARSALQCAIDVQRDLAAAAERDPERAIRVRIGLHTGEAIVDRDGDLFGRHVIIAARVANLAAGGQILTTGLVREIAAARGDIEFGEARSVPLKGIEGTHVIHDVRW